MENYRKYDEPFKQSIVNLYHSGKTQTSLSKEYGVSMTAISKWVKQYSEVRIDDETILNMLATSSESFVTAIILFNLFLKKGTPMTIQWFRLF